MNIGENLKKLRLSKGLTQEQAAEVFGVSPQAISRWENDSAYPDITLLPGIAIFYDTSIDAIVSMDELRRTEKLNRVHGEVLELVARGCEEEAVALLKATLKLHPGDEGLLMALSETLAHSNGPKAVEEAIAVSERVLKSNTISMKARCTATVNLLHLYRRAGRTEAARELVRSLPHIWESREMLAPEVFEGAEYREALAESVRRALVFLCQRIAACEEERDSVPSYIQLGVNFDTDAEVQELLVQIGAFLEESETH